MLHGGEASMGLQFRNLLKRMGVIQEKERERPLSGWWMLFLQEHLFPFNCLATISSTDLPSCLLPFQIVEGGVNREGGGKGKAGWAKEVRESTLPYAGVLRCSVTGQAACLSSEGKMCHLE